MGAAAAAAARQRPRMLAAGLCEVVCGATVGRVSWTSVIMMAAMIVAKPFSGQGNARLSIQAGTGGPGGGGVA